MKLLFRELTTGPFLALMGISLSLTYLIPPNYVTALPLVGPVLQWMMKHIPSLSMHVAASKFPDIAYVYFPLMTLISPLMFFHVWVLKEQKSHWMDAFAEKSIRTYLRLLLMPPIILIFAWLAFGVGGTQLDPTPWNEKKWALALFGFAPTGGAMWGMLAMFVVGLKVVFENKESK